MAGNQDDPFLRLGDQWQGNEKDYDGTLDQSSPGNSDKPPQVDLDGAHYEQFFTVDLHAVREVESTIYHRTQQLLTQYDALLDRVKQHIIDKNLLGENIKVTVDWTYGVANSNSPTVPEDVYSNVHTYTDEEPDIEKAIRDKITEGGANDKAYTSIRQVLHGTANTIFEVGQYAELLNRAGQLYTHADQSCVMPQPGDAIPPKKP